MATLLTEAFLSALLYGAVSAGVPLLLAGLGEQISEKAGVLNIGLEGMMLCGAYAGFVAAWTTGSFALGFVVGAAAGLLVALVMILLCVRLALDQIVVGIALTLGAQGLTALLHHFQFARSYPRLPAAATWPLPGLADLPVLGPALFDRHPVVYGAVLAIPLLVVMQRRTRLDLHLRAAGERPEALDVAGVDVTVVRAAAVAATGTLAGLGGAFLANLGAGLFVPFLTNGAGFIAIVLAMLARGRPPWVLLGALLFGACLSLTTAIQVAGINVPTDIVQMLPFAAVILVLVLLGRRASLPAALGRPYVRGGG